MSSYYKQQKVEQIEQKASKKMHQIKILNDMKYHGQTIEHHLSSKSNHRKQLPSISYPTNQVKNPSYSRQKTLISLNKAKLSNISKFPIAESSCQQLTFQLNEVKNPSFSRRKAIISSQKCKHLTSKFQIYSHIAKEEKGKLNISTYITTRSTLQQWNVSKST